MKKCDEQAINRDEQAINRDEQARGVKMEGKFTTEDTE
jgi:hypothetical protein